MLSNGKIKKNVLVQLFFAENKCMFEAFIKMNKEL